MWCSEVWSEWNIFEVQKLNLRNTSNIDMGFIALCWSSWSYYQQDFWSGHISISSNIDHSPSSYQRFHESCHCTQVLEHGLKIRNLVNFTFQPPKGILNLTSFWINQGTKYHWMKKLPSPYFIILINRPVQQTWRFYNLALSRPVPHKHIIVIIITMIKVIIIIIKLIIATFQPCFFKILPVAWLVATAIKTWAIFRMNNIISNSLIYILLALQSKISMSKSVFSDKRIQNAVFSHFFATNKAF